MKKEKVTIEIRNRWNNDLIFSLEAFDNSFRNTVLSAIKSGTDLRNADLSNADLRGADLRNADLRGADLRGACLSKKDIIKIKHLYQIIPEEGTFVAWKKAAGYILKLEIHASAKRTCNIKNRKCRASKVRVLEIQNIDGTKSNARECVGDHDNKTKYIIGKVTKADSFDDNFLQDCTNGIHFFITRQEAVNW